VTARTGYDDNVFLSSFDPVESIFTNVAVGVAYRFGSPRTQMSLSANVGTTYYWSVDEDFDDDFGAEDEDDGHFDFNASLGFSITHRASARLTLAATLFASYQSQPDFNTFNATTISVGRQSRDFFAGSNRFSAAYAWTPRFSTNTSYSLGLVFYDDDLISSFEDRVEHTIGNEFRFLVLPTTSAIGEYRFAFVDYTDAEGRNSHSHFFLAGVDHSFSPRFNVSARAGVEVREFDNDFIGQDDETRTAPYAEATLNYAIAQSTQITWFNRFSLEQPDVPESFSRQTFRTALSLRHNFTARISAGLNVAYQHDDNEGSFDIGGFDEDSFDISLGVRYAISRNWAIDAGYTHTEVVSDEALFREFSRNRYYVGATFTF
jgi:opacity protein-like surface antigen